jgi:hypothetical protein
VSDSDPYEPAYRLGDRVAFVVEPVPGEPVEQAVLLHLPSGRRTVLSPEATAIWRLLAAAGVAGVRPGDIAAELAHQFDAKPTVIEHDVRQLLEELVSADLAARVERAPPAAQ